MQFIKQSIPDVIVIEPTVHGDARGYFTETFRQDLFEEAVGYQVNFLQDNESRSSKGVLRGLHFQLAPFAQSKLVRVIEGRVLDVAVELSADNKRQLFVPRGFAHGFVVLSEAATFVYKVDNYYSPECDRGLAFDDPELDINWCLPKEDLILPEKDRRQPLFADLPEYFNMAKNDV